ncbi:hypothetical protein AMTRI_Chr09g37530 [Amborella trichopoda]|uniref:Uncharacterized protein n=1 Tax=Amborella trichopoda TaxID=13333 RepID=W1PKJ6_AMBTC|nr:GDSL esterase/lipase At5g45950 [Amborella trichopoda]ERN08161.1 hypothetical protein AMTR_s00018p00139800 [Amborella trichopoda]|eukprot:XP_006846486.1 GDSL esterase/lipase At5g45950 [Amborella trichopoda]
MFNAGGRRFSVVGIPPLGCLPLIRNALLAGDCALFFNDIAISFNNKIKTALATFAKVLGLDVKVVYADIYEVIQDAVHNPSKYGFVEASRGCCGTGLQEFGATCRGQPTCSDPIKYVFFDAVHPTERMYSFMANTIVTRDLY